MATNRKLACLHFNSTTSITWPKITALGASLWPASERTFLTRLCPKASYNQGQKNYLQGR